MLICLILGLLIGGRRLRYHPPTVASPTAEAGEVVAT
jgi:hypothetical protein